jgi:hypothetical protein
MANEIEISITGKDRGAISVMDDTRKSADRLGEGFDKAGEKADTGEQRILGLNDTISGTAAIMKGPGADGIGAYVQGWADLAGGVANFVIPAVKSMTKAVFLSAIEHVKAAGTTVVSWVTMATQATINAARIAVAWVVALGPVGWAIGLLVALGLAFVVLWKTSERFRAIVIGAVSGVWNWLRHNWPLLLAILTGPFGLAVLWIVRKWDTLVAFVRGLPGRMRSVGSGLWDWVKESFRGVINTVIDWWNNFDFTAPTVHIPGTNLNVGGFTIGLPDIPRLARGGIAGGLAFVGDAGTELVDLPQGSHVRPHGSFPSGFGGQDVRVVLELRSGGSRWDDFLIEAIRKAVGDRGGNVQTVIGRN